MPPITQSLQLNYNPTLKVLIFGLAVVLAVSIKSVFFSFGFFVLLIIWDKKFIIPSLLITPVIETILIVAEANITVTKLLAAFIIIYFLLHTTLNKTFYWDKNIGWLIVFLGITIMGTAIGLYSLNPHLTSETIYYNLINVFPKIIFVYFLFNFLLIKGKIFFFESILLTTYAITLALIIVLVYFVFFKFSEIEWGLTLTRLTFEDADPNEFAGIILALGTFSFFLMFSEKSKYTTSFGIIAVVLLIYSVVLTLSRGGILTLLFLFLLFFISFYKQSFKKTILAGILTLIILGILIKLDLINVYAVSERFFVGTDFDAGQMTTGRTHLFRVALEAFLKKPVFGYGNTPYTATMLTYHEIGKAAVIHNIYLEILIRFGLVGLSVFLVLIWNATKGFFLFLRTSNEKKPEPLFILPIIAFLVMLFSGLALSWQWRDILWYLLGISMGSTYFIYKMIEE